MAFNLRRLCTAGLPVRRKPCRCLGLKSGESRGAVAPLGIAQRKRTNFSPGARRLVGQHGRANGAHDCGVRPLRGRGAQRPGGMGGRRSRPGGIEKGGFPPLRRPLFSARPIFAFVAYFFSTLVMYFGYIWLTPVRRRLAASKNGPNPLSHQGKRRNRRPSSVNSRAPQESILRPSRVKKTPLISQ